MAFAGYLKQSTAVDILLGPFLDDADGKTAETGLTLDVELSKNGQGLANKNDATAPVADSGGDVDGYYNCELDTTDTNTLGLLTLVAHATGALPVRLDFQVVTANWYDSMCSTDNLDVNVTNIEGSDATDQINAACDTAISDYAPATVTSIIAGIADGSYDLQEMIRIMFAALAGKSAGGGTATITFRDSADTKNRVSATVDANGNRTAITVDGS